MSSSKYDTDQWMLGAFLQWKPKMRAVTCDHCNGTGSVGGHFKDLDGPQQCPKCFGTGIVNVRPDTPEPAIPEELREHMRRAWWDFHNQSTGKEQP